MRRVSSSAAIGLLDQLRRLQKFRYLLILVGIWIAMSAEYTPTPIYTPVENWAVDKGAEITSTTKDWIWRNVANQVLIWD